MNSDEMRRLANIIGVLFAAFLVFLWTAALFVAVHFIRKFW